MPSKSALMDPISDKGENAGKICLNVAHKSKGGKMPSKSASMGTLSEKRGKCHQNML